MYFSVWVMAFGRVYAPDISASSNEPPPASDESWRVTIGAAGDMVPHQGVVQTAAHQAETPDQEGDDRFDGWWYVFKRLKPSVEKADISLVNLETPLATLKNRSTSTNPLMNGPKAAADALKETGFDILNLANNHMFDQQRSGVSETIATVEEAGLSWIGAGRDRNSALTPTITDVNGARVAFFGWTYNSNRLPNNAKVADPWVAKWDAAQAEQAVEQLRGKVDIIIVSVHFDADFRFTVQAHQQRIAKRLCRAGVDLVVGSGPHVLHPVKLIRDEISGRTCVVAYSLGNLVSNQGFKYRLNDPTPREKRSPKTCGEARDGMFLRVTFAKRKGRVVVDGIEGVALWTMNNWLRRYASPTPRQRISIVPIERALKHHPPNPVTLKIRRQAIARAVGDAVVLVPE